MELLEGMELMVVMEHVVRQDLEENLDLPVVVADAIHPTVVHAKMDATEKMVRKVILDRKVTRELWTFQTQHFIATTYFITVPRNLPVGKLDLQRFILDGMLDSIVKDC